MSHSRNQSMDENGPASTGRILREKNLNDNGGVSMPDGKHLGTSGKGTMSRKNNRKSRANLRAAAAAQAALGSKEGLKQSAEPFSGGDQMMNPGYFSAEGASKIKDSGYLSDKDSVQRKISSEKSPLVSNFSVAQPSEYMGESQNIVGSYESDRFRYSSASLDVNAAHPTIDLNDMAAVRRVYPGLEVEIKKHIEDASWKQKDDEKRDNWADSKKAHPSFPNFEEQRKHSLELQYKFKDFPLVAEMEFEAKLAEIRRESGKQLYRLLSADEAAKATKAAEEGKFPDTKEEREEWVRKIIRAFLFPTTVDPLYGDINDPEEAKLGKQTLIEMDLNPRQRAEEEFNARDRILNLFRDGPRAHLILQNGARKMMTLANEIQESGGIQIVANPGKLTLFSSWKARMDEMIKLCGESKTYALTFLSATDIDRAVLTPGTSTEFYKKEVAAEFEHRKKMQLFRGREDAERALQVESLARKVRLASMEASLNSILSRFRAQEAAFWSREHENAATPENAFFDPIARENFGADFNSIMYGTVAAKQVEEARPKMGLKDVSLRGKTAQGALSVIPAEGGTEGER